MRLAVKAVDDRLLTRAGKAARQRSVPGSAAGILALQRLAGNAAVASLLGRPVTLQRTGCARRCDCDSCGGEEDKFGDDDALPATVQRTESGNGDALAEDLPQCSFGQEPAIAAAPAIGVEELNVSRSADAQKTDCSPTNQQNGTVVCDGKGGFRVHYGAYEHRPWLKPCVTKHEQSHIRDFERDAPNSCKYSDGTPVCDGERAGDHVRFTKQGVDPGDWQRHSECTAPHIGYKCGEAALATATLDYEQSWRAYIKNEQALIDANCD